MRAITHEKTGLRPRLDQATIFQREISLHRRGHADLVLATGAPDRGNAVAGAEHTAFNHLAHAARDPRIKRFALREAEDKVREITMLIEYQSYTRSRT